MGITREYGKHARRNIVRRGERCCVDMLPPFEKLLHCSTGFPYHIEPRNLGLAGSVYARLKSSARQNCISARKLTHAAGIMVLSKSSHRRVLFLNIFSAITIRGYCRPQPSFGGSPCVWHIFRWLLLR